MRLRIHSGNTSETFKSQFRGTDKDGIPDVTDLDDGDGYLDSEETAKGSVKIRSVPAGMITPVLKT